MPLRIPTIFPKALLAAMRKPVGQMRVSPLLVDACKVRGLSYKLVDRRLRNGWTATEALS